MKRQLRVIAFLLLSAILLTGCSAFDSASPAEKLLQSSAAIAERVISGRVGAAKSINFPALQEVNPEIYAWLSIPGTSVSAPVAQSETQDIAFYQSHGWDRSENERGCLYTHFRYSDKRFGDRVSVIYGKSESSLSVLDGLEELYRSGDSLQEHNRIAVITEDQVLRYQVFCASEFSDALISRDYNQFQSEADILAFLEDVQGYHTLRRQTDESVNITPGDRILVLTKKLSRDEAQRFLVLAKLVETTN